MNHVDQVVCADIPLDSRRYPIKELLEAFRDAAAIRPDIRLVLAGRRTRSDDFSVWNFLEERKLNDRVKFLPYYDRCREFPLKKADCPLWVARNTNPFELSSAWLLNGLDQGRKRRRVALFVTCFHPAKFEGNSTLMRIWLDHLRACGYDVHVVYYMYDIHQVTEEMRSKARCEYERYVEVEVSSALVGKNKNGLNVHVDDWCGEELLKAAEELSSEFEYDVAIVNYTFMSAVFDVVASYTNKILLTHDRFANRNRAMLEAGYTESGWISTTEEGERLACKRADIVVALQEREAAYFRRLCSDGSKVVVASPTLPPRQHRSDGHPGWKLRIGYFGSTNWVNEQNLGAYLRAWLASPDLREQTKIVVAGGLDRDLFCRIVPDGEAILDRVRPELLGKLPDLQRFFDSCDIVINPDRGGTGIKIKTLEALAAGAALISTTAGAVGIESSCRFHSARTIEELAQLTAEVAIDRSLLAVVRDESVRVYRSYWMRNHAAMERLLGAPFRYRSPFRMRPADPRDLQIPDHVKRFAADYQIDEFRKFFERVDVRGKSVLEVGSDFHLVTARLFAANGAQRIVATNIGDWRSEEPLPSNVEYRIGDVSDSDLTSGSFDIVYGVAVLEHIPDMKRFSTAVGRLLKADGVAYLQGCPLWPSALGHHVWVEKTKDEIAQQEGEDATASISNVLFSFADQGRNPIPNWAHLAFDAAGLRTDLVARGLSSDQAERIVRFVYNTDGRMTGACSNFKSATEIIASFQESFRVTTARTIEDRANEYFGLARARYSETDLSTLGLMLWLQPRSGEDLSAEIRTKPKVSIIVPYYNVEPYIGDCLASILKQEYGDLEVILVDDASEDGSRQIAERFASKDPRIRIVTHQSNRGLGPARNTGVRHATGDYILFLDSDDLLADSSVIGRLATAARESACRVVAGASIRLLPNGQLQPEDELHAKGRLNEAGGLVTGIDTFLAPLWLPSSHYLPPRAWGTLIERSFYDQAALDFPPGEHEDLSHTAFLYFSAGCVQYLGGEPIIAYRTRDGSLSSTPWTEQKLKRYGEIWQDFKQNTSRFGLDAYLGDAAINFICHMIWRMEQTNFDHVGKDMAASVAKDIFQDIRSVAFKDHVYDRIDYIRRFFGEAMQSRHYFDELTRSMPADFLLGYYARRLRQLGPQPDVKAMDLPEMIRTVASQGDVSTAMIASSPDSHLALALDSNNARLKEVFSEYERDASEAVKSLPAMLTVGDRALYFWAAKHFSFVGTIVDAGCFVGGTTTSLIHGLLKNPLLDANRKHASKLIRVYDLFRVDDHYILEHLQEKYPQRRFQSGDSFLPVFEENMAGFGDYLDVRPGDVLKTGYPDELPIEVFGVDICKALPVTDFVVREFFPRLMVGALIIQQDFIHEFHPHIHLSMLLLEDHFEKHVEVEWGGSVAYRCVRPITPGTIKDRFGEDSSWFTRTDSNAARLRGLVNEMLYDGNRWTILLTLAMYYAANGRSTEARSVYLEACERFPQFTPHEATRRLLEE